MINTYECGKVSVGKDFSYLIGGAAKDVVNAIEKSGPDRTMIDTHCLNAV
jgi:hypothetical protein